jgi:hypothetical protein
MTQALAHRTDVLLEPPKALSVASVAVGEREVRRGVRYRLRSGPIFMLEGAASRAAWESGM